VESIFSSRPGFRVPAAARIFAPRMKLSVIIVNYNVKAYLEQCLRSVYEALHGLEGEVFVVDNLSTDGSVEMVRERFPQVKLIANRENVGFSRANNQAIHESRGEYVLLLNPDTVVGEDVFHQVVRFLDGHPKAGGLGVKMIDGTGRFLPESKRGLPTPTVAFFKIMGLSRLFPRSRYFGRYHLGHLPENEAASIEILSGACMFLRKSVLDQVGLLDESFFMYGEDIDLSYRITLGGHENWYLPEARIIHYKGESTKKSSVNYVFVFYNAMVIFARKHFTRRGPQLFAAIIRGAIYLSAAAAIVMRFLRKALLPLADLALARLVIRLLGHAGLVPELPTSTVLGLGAGIIGLMAFFGLYDLPMKWTNVVKGFGVVVLAAAVARTKPGIAGMGLLTMVLSISTGLFALRWLLHVTGIRRNSFSTSAGREGARILAAGSPREAKLALGLLWQTHYGLDREIVLGADELEHPQGMARMGALIKDHRINEVVFCAKDMGTGRIIAAMEALRKVGVVFKIAQPASEFIIGPSTTESIQDLLVLRDHAVNSASARRRRRILDIGLSLAFLATAPLTIWFVPQRTGFLRNLAAVLKGRLTWVGYHMPKADPRLPKLPPSVMEVPALAGTAITPRYAKRLNLEYAKDYRVWQDLGRVLRNFRRLGVQAGDRAVA
jgi:GT2 family glycosyltransferase